MEPSLQTQPDLHAHIRSLLCNQHFGTLTPSRISSDCWVILNKVRLIVYEYMQDSYDEQTNIQGLYQHVNQNFCSNPEQFDILNPKTMSKTSNFFEVIIIPVIQYFLKQWNTYKDCNVLQNRINHTKMDIIECLCMENNNSTVMEQSISNSRFCYKCGQLFHKVCFNIQQQQNQHYQCPTCFVTNCLPDRHVINTIYKSYLPPAQQNQTISSIIPVEWPITRLCANREIIQLRCVRIGCQYEITWPELCDIYLDDVISVSYVPLSVNSPLKRRYDHPIIVPVRDLSCSQRIRISQKYTGVSAWHLITVCLVKQRNEKEIFREMFNDPAHSINQSQSKNYLQRLFWKSNCLQMEQIKISNKCQFYSEKITYPCRSRHCTNHYQPFDLYSFICSSVMAKSSIKRWKCPICGVRAYDIVRDLYLEKAMTESQSSQKKQTSFVCRQDSVMKRVDQ